MTELENLIAKCEQNAVPDDKIDYSDCPPLTDEQLARMRPCHLINNSFWKPQKVVLNTRIDADILYEIKKSGKGWQTRFNDFLRKAVSTGAL